LQPNKTTKQDADSLGLLSPFKDLLTYLLITYLQW